MDLNSKILFCLFALVLAYVTFQPVFDDRAYKREIEIIATMHVANNKECPNKNGMDLIKAYYLPTITLPVQRNWVSINFDDVFYSHCRKLKKI